MTFWPGRRRGAGTAPSPRSPPAVSGHRALEDAAHRGEPAPEQRPQRWPVRLRETVEADEALRRRLTADKPDTAPGGQGKSHPQLDKLAHQMFGLIGHAADPEAADLSDHPTLVVAVTELCRQAEQAATP